jgi:hypothetical protein
MTTYRFGPDAALLLESGTGAYFFVDGDPATVEACDETGPAHSSHVLVLWGLPAAARSEDVDDEDGAFLGVGTVFQLESDLADCDVAPDPPSPSLSPPPRASAKFTVRARPPKDEPCILVFASEAARASSKVINANPLGFPVARSFLILTP